MTTVTSPDPSTFDADAFVEQASQLIGLPIDAVYRPGVVQNLALISRMAALVVGLPLTPADEPAPVYVPAEPGA